MADTNSEKRAIDTLMLEVMSYRICENFKNQKCESCLGNLVGAWKRWKANLSNTKWVRNVNSWLVVTEVIIQSYETEDTEIFDVIIERLHHADITELASSTIDCAKMVFQTKKLLSYYNNGNIRKAKRSLQEHRDQLLHYEQLETLLKHTNSTYPQELSLKGLQKYLLPFVAHCMEALGEADIDVMFGHMIMSNPSPNNKEGKNEIKKARTVDHEELQTTSSKDSNPENPPSIQTRTSSKRLQEDPVKSPTNFPNKRLQRRITRNTSEVRRTGKSRSLSPHVPSSSKRTTVNDFIHSMRSVSTHKNSSNFHLSPTGKIQTNKKQEKANEEPHKASNTAKRHLWDEDETNERKRKSTGGPNKKNSSDQQEENIGSYSGNSPPKSPKSILEGSYEASVSTASSSQHLERGEISQLKKRKTVNNDIKVEEDSLHWSDDDDDNFHLYKSVAPGGRVKFTYEEEKSIVDGVKRFGVGNWQKILSHYSFHPSRTGVKLKDKYRTMKNQGII